MPPSAVTSIMSSQIISTFDIDKPEKLNKLFRKFGDQGVGFFQMVETFGWSKPVAQETYSHFEEDWIHNTFHSLGLVSAPGAGANAVITLDPQDLDTGNRFYPRYLDTVFFTNEVTGQIIDVDISTPTAPVITVKPNRAADDIGAIPAGAELVIISNAHSEGSGQPQSRVTSIFELENNVQIVKEKLTATGTEMTNQKWFNELSQPEGGKTAIPMYYLKGQLDTDFRMQLQLDGALLFQRRTDNNIIDALNPNVPNAEVLTTEGLVPFIDRLGNTINYSPGLFTVEKFDEACKTFEKNFASDNICVLSGINLNLEIENTLVDYFKDTNIDYRVKSMTDSYFQGNEGLSTSIGFKYLMKGQRMFSLKAMRVFNNPRTFGGLRDIQLLD